MLSSIELRIYNTNINASAAERLEESTVLYYTVDGPVALLRWALVIVIVHRINRGNIAKMFTLIHTRLLCILNAVFRIHCRVCEEVYILVNIGLMDHD